LYVVSLLMGVGGGIIVPSAMALTVIGGARHRAMGSVVSLMTASDNIGLALGPMLGGALIETAGHPIAMGGLGLLMAGAVLAIHRGGALRRAASTTS
jgi:MFS family permease